MAKIAKNNNGTIKIALAGLGVVGGGVLSLLQKNAAEISLRTGKKVEVVAVSSRKKRPKFKWYKNALDLVKTDASIIIEAIGGENGIALELARKTLKAKKHFITANKAMLAHHGAELAELAEKNGVALCYEAAVAGGIPVIKTAREGLAANKIKRITGILNGTSNYILTAMTERGIEFPQILKEAQEKGYAEADPTFDVGGIDASHKITLLAANAFGAKPNFKDMYIEGIEKITVSDIKFAERLGFVIKHLCIAEKSGGKFSQTAYPCLLAKAHPLAGINDVFNAIEFESEPVGVTVLSGRGAGAGPTASAVVSDVIDILNGRITSAFTVPYKKLSTLKLQKIDDLQNSFYLRLMVRDETGVLEKITAILKQNGISIKKLLQDDEGKNAEIIIITHNVLEQKMKKAIKKLQGLSSIIKLPQIIRVVSAI